MNTFKLSRRFWDYAFENPDKVRPVHCALYFFIIEHSNRLGWKEKVGLPTSMAMDAIGVKNYKTFGNALKDLVEWGFVNLIEKSRNQYSSNVVALVKNTEASTEADTEALTKALSYHAPKQVQSIASIDKPITNNLEPITNNNTLSPKKEGKKKKKVEPLHAPLKQIFLNTYENHFHRPFYWAIKDAAGLNKLIDKIRFMDGGLDDQGVTDNFTALLYAILNHPNKNKFVYEKFSPSIINSQFNEILNQYNNADTGGVDLEDLFKDLPN